jgi:ABC-2 type transport system permease protein
MTAVLSLIRKEFIQIRRDPRLLPILFLSPILQLIILGYAANFDVRDIPLVVCDQDRSAAGRDFVNGFLNSGYFSERARVSSPDDIDAFLDNSRASLAIVIPRGFGDDLAADREARVQIIADGADSSSAVIGLGYASLVSGRFARKILLERLERIPRAGPAPVLFEPKIRVWYNPDLRSLNFMAPAVLALVLMAMTMMLTSMGIVREKETGTLEQLIVTPIRPWQLILGKLLPFVLVGFIDVLLVVGVVALWFQVPVRGSLLLLFGMCLLFMLTTLGLGLFLSTISRNQQQAMLTAVFFMLPQILLSGFAFPIENMPRVFQLITTIIPLKYFFIVIRGIFLKGVGWPELWDEAAAMLVFGVLILALSVARFKKRIE